MSAPMPENTPENAPPTPPPAPASPVQGTPASASPGTPASPPARIGDQNAFSVEATLRGIADSLTALPERIVDGVREAGQAAPPAPVVNTPEPTNSPVTTETPKGRKTFGEWWFSND